jgi:ankyrin repeat protein
MEGYLDQNPTFIDQPDRNGWSALHFAVRGGHDEIVVMLLEKGANIHLKTGTGRSTLDLTTMKFGEDSHMHDILEHYLD